MFTSSELEQVKHTYIIEGGIWKSDTFKSIHLHLKDNQITSLSIIGTLVDDHLQVLPTPTWVWITEIVNNLSNSLWTFMYSVVKSP